MVNYREEQEMHASQMTEEEQVSRLDGMMGEGVGARVLAMELSTGFIAASGVKASAEDLVMVSHYIMGGLESVAEEQGAGEYVDANEPLDGDDIEAADPGACVRLTNKGLSYHRVRVTGGRWIPFVPEDGMVMSGVEYTAEEMMADAGLTGDVWYYIGDYMQWGIDPSDIGYGGEVAKA